MAFASERREVIKELLELVSLAKGGAGFYL
jgi:hypothetical protein